MEINKEDDYTSEYKLTYEGKPFVTLKANHKMEPGEAFVEMINALISYYWGEEEKQDEETLL